MVEAEGVGLVYLEVAIEYPELVGMGLFRIGNEALPDAGHSPGSELVRPWVPPVPIADD